MNNVNSWALNDYSKLEMTGIELNARTHMFEVVSAVSLSIKDAYKNGGAPAGIQLCTPELQCH